MGTKRRTRQQKIIAQLKKRANLINDVKRKSQKRIKKEIKNSDEPENSSLFFTSPALIKKDLIKTIIISLLFLVGILIIWFLKR